MKKLFLVFIIFLLSCFLNICNAETIKVKVPIDLTSIWITCLWWQNSWWWDWDNHVSTSTYECSIETWFASVEKSIWKIIMYFTFIAWLAWVLYIIFNWIMLSMAWLDQNMEKSAKDNIKKALIGLIILLLSWTILNFIAPWIYK